MLRFIVGLIRPYRGTLVLIFGAMLVETAMSLASPWPLKVILDSVIVDLRSSRFSLRNHRPACCSKSLDTASAQVHNNRPPDCRSDVAIPSGEENS